MRDCDGRAVGVEGGDCWAGKGRGRIEGGEQGYGVDVEEEFGVEGGLLGPWSLRAPHRPEERPKR